MPTESWHTYDGRQGLIKTRALPWQSVPAAIWLLAKAIGKESSIPLLRRSISSQVENDVYTGNRLNGGNVSLTDVCFGVTSSVTPWSANDTPTMILAAIFAKRTFVAFDTNGDVRLARGFFQHVDEIHVTFMFDRVLHIH